MRTFVERTIRYHTRRILTIKPVTKHHVFIKWFSRVSLLILLVVGWITLRRNNITTIH